MSRVVCWEGSTHRPAGPEKDPSEVVLEKVLSLCGIQIAEVLT